MRHTKISPK
jgi:hypothetical protein